jgi:preprotein translocase subunit SecD
MPKPMRKLIYTLSMIAAFVVGCWTACSETTNVTLRFYIVSEQKIDGGRFIDVTNLPKLGYIAANPDLIVTNLADVFRGKEANFAIMGDGKGKHTIMPTHPLPSLTVKLTPDDAKRFTTLTEKALDKRLLIMLGEKLLAAPRVLIPIEAPAFGIDFVSEAELKKAEDDLRKLVQSAFD